jgi:UDP-N-acetylglucosamine 2-epimerase
VPSVDDARALRPRVAPERIYVVGEPAVDAVRRFGQRATLRAAWKDHRVEPGGYTLVSSGFGGEDDLPADAVVEPAPAGYVEHLSLLQSARAVLTRSPRVGYEAAALGVPCLHETARDGADAHGLPLWDGRAGARVARVLVANFARVRLN